ncbi:MAG: hypothetical protein MK052_01410 [Alphaproteobacteria bacterium]|nr:hypothetical protein [Alphaproteobacteria bacterium]
MIFSTTILLAACLGPRDDSWNSYYYGTGRSSNSLYGNYPSDNDDNYVIPWGTYEDNQMPQGQKW